MRLTSVAVRGSGTRVQYGEPRPVVSPNMTWPRMCGVVPPTPPGPVSGGGNGVRKKIVRLRASKQWNEATS
jgi:hypothetical protein